MHLDCYVCLCSNLESDTSFYAVTPYVMLLCKWDVTCGKILTHKKLSRFKNKIFMQIRFSLDVIVHVHFLDLIHDKISFIF